MNTIRIESPSGMRSIQYRKKSATDKIVIDEIFHHQIFSLLGFKQYRLLFKWYSNNIEKGLLPIIVDAGANIGAASLWFSMLYPTAEILAIEPEKNNLKILKANVAEFNVNIFEGALGSVEGNMILCDQGKGDWGFQVLENGEGYNVMVFTGDMIMATVQTQNKFSFICKIDIEGGESNLFRYNTEWLKSFVLIIVEIHDWMLPGEANSKNFFRFIGENNFDIVHRGQLIFAFNIELLVT